MKTVSGDLRLMSLQEILVWAETHGKTGSLKISGRGNEKTFYLQEGKLTFVTSNRSGERIGEFLASTEHIQLDEITELIEQSHKEGMPFTGYLLAQQRLTEQELESIISQLATLALVDAISWESGSFSFTDTIPPTILNGPIRIKLTNAVEQALQLIRVDRASRPDAKRELLRKITQKLAAQDFEIPPMPEILSRIYAKMQDSTSDAHEIMKIIMADQILTAKVLKTVNSSYYGLPNRVTSVQHAVVVVGFREILNVVTAHELTKLASRNKAAVREILVHCLRCAFIAKTLATQAGLDEEETFVCALLHDIGKTVLINTLEDYTLPPEARGLLLREYHQQAGAILALKWNLSTAIHNVIRYHHGPEQAPKDKAFAELVFLANAISNGLEDLGHCLSRCSALPVERLRIEEIQANKEEMDQAILNFM